MKIKILLASFSFLSLTLPLNALIINEVMSNPIGDDSGREWIEIYNNSTEPVNLSTITISVKGATPVGVTSLSGGTTLPASGYAIIGSVVSGVSRFGQDYSDYSGPLFKSAISLVNTGVTSLDIRMQGVTLNTISSYTPAKEGLTYSYIQRSYVTGVPTPGKENESAASLSADTSTSATSTNPNQVTVAQMTPPSSDMVIYLPKEKTVVAGALTNYSVSAMTNAGKAIDHMIFNWSFGDGGQRVGSSTMYRYMYPGKYIIHVEGGNGLVTGSGRMSVRVVAPDVVLTNIKASRYGPYISLINPNNYDLDISDWKFSIDGNLFSFPKNTFLGLGETKFPGGAMGFASTTYSSSSIIKLLFPTMEELLRISQETVEASSTIITTQLKNSIKESSKIIVIKKFTPPVRAKGETTAIFASSTLDSPVSINKREEKDTRIANVIKSWFSK